MTTFLRLLVDKDKGEGLLATCKAVRDNVEDARVFEVAPESFRAVPGAPFSYWVTDEVRGVFKRLPPFECDGRAVRQGLATADDFRFVRNWWEVGPDTHNWANLAKGGSFSRFYASMPCVVKWGKGGEEVASFAGSVIRNPDYYFSPGLTWPLRGIKYSSQAVPSGCVFSVAGKMAFAPVGELRYWLALFNSCPFDYLIRLFAGKVGGVQYEVGLISGIPVVAARSEQASRLMSLSHRAWSLKRTLDTVVETSHAFLLPAALRPALGIYDPPAIEVELARIQAEIDALAFDLYGFSDADRTAAQASDRAAVRGEPEGEAAEDDAEDEDTATPIDHMSGLLSWTVGVAFGRFDWRLATGERSAPPDPDPFDPLPAKSPGMLPDEAAPFHTCAGILVDDPGHPDDLARLVEEVLARVENPVHSDVRRWLQRDFFQFHLQRYSKSRRKAPIYWPLSTTSGSYTIWLYYPSLTTQSLYTAVNDFIEPKLKRVGQDVAALRTKGSGRSRDEEKNLEALQALELELLELRDALLQIAPTYRPSHDDGVQITAAPLWPLFRLKPWQRVLKDTWAKLEKGDYDWAHLAMAYWPERVREKCKTDKSLAIAHGLEELYVEPEPKAVKARGRKKAAVE